ncbi:MAG: hypothetical protein H6736_17635 [Alphaproteobacteria bacterium]|nr:hypothetical protein [Alphaproteobacteria bacterium]
MRWFIAFAAVALVACKGNTPEGTDADGDGHFAGEDCDDANAAINPGAVERCNGIDDDCDGDIDEGMTLTFYADADNDSFGDANAVQQACEQPTGYVRNDDDCDDTDFDISPDSIEICDDIDHNCDGDPRAGAVGGDFWWFDADGDGYGSSTQEIRSCDTPAGTYVLAVVGEADCDDNDPDRNPGADEICDLIDNDCSGQIDDDPVSGDLLNVDTDGDGYGDPAVAVLACRLGDPVDVDGNGTIDGVTVDNADDCDDTTGTVSPAATEICDGIDNDCDPATPEDAFATDTQDWWRDVDGDGSGVSSDTIRACTQPTGYVEVGPEDCDDTTDTRSPSAFEVCDGIDNDCDTVIDDNATDAPTWWLDEDGDLLGNGSADSFTACDQPVGHVDNGDDCDDTTDTIGPPDAYYADTDADTYGDPNVRLDSCDPVAGYVLDDQDCDDSDPDLSPETPWYFDSDFDGYGDDLVVQQACLQPAGYVRDGGDCEDGNDLINPSVPDGPPADGIDDDCDGFLDEDSVVDHCGTISADEVWGGGSIHTVTCTVNVQGAGQPHLIIQPGATVRFDEGASLRVGVGGVGSLDAQGVTFEHSDRVTPGRWDGIEFGANDNPANPSQITASTIRDASGFGVKVTNSPMILDAVDIQDTVGPAVLLSTNATLSITNSTLSNNVGSGIDGDQTSQLDDFSANTITGNADKPIKMSAASLPRLDTGSVYAGNSDDVIRLLTGTLREDTTWRGDLGVAYEVSGQMRVEDGSAPILTVQDGVYAAFTSGSGLYVGISDVGTLEVAGSYTDLGTGTEYDRYVYGVTFTSVAGNPGTWRGVELGTLAGDGAIAGLDIRNAGGNAIGGGLRLVGDGTVDPEDRLDITIDQSRFARSSSAGLYADNVQLNVSDTRFVDNVTYGFDLKSGVVRTNSSVSASTSMNNAQSGVRVYPTLVELLDDGNVYAGNNLPLEITAGIVLDSATWNPLSEDYYVSGLVEIRNVDGPIVTTTAGTTLYFGDLGQLVVGVGDQGSLIAAGTATDPVVFTALSEVTTGNPVRGNWEGLTFGSAQRQSALTYAEVAYAGKTTTKGAVTFLQRSVNPVVLDHVNIHDSGADGVQSLTVGLEAQHLEIRDSMFVDNDDIGVNIGQRGLRDLGPGVHSFYRNTVTGNGLNGVTVAAGSGGRISTDNVIGNNNLVTGLHDFIGLYGGSITEDMTLSKQLDDQNDVLPYRLLTSSLRVRDAAILTIEPGVVMEVDDTAVNNGIEIIIGRDDQAGGIHAVGTALEPIRFTSAAEFPTYGDWAGISLGEECLTTVVGGCKLDYVTIDYAGSSGALGSDRAALSVYLRDPISQPEPALVSHAVIRHSLAHGMMAFWDGSVVTFPTINGVSTPFNFGLEDCTDGIDNDLDSFTDCDDTKCAATYGCSGFLYDEKEWLVCEDDDGNGICEDEPWLSTFENHNYCWNGSSHGNTNYFCDNIDGNYFARDAQNPYTASICFQPGPGIGAAQCSGAPSWAN